MSKAWGVTQNKLKGRLCCIAATGLVIWGFVIFSIHELPPGDKHQLSGIHEADAKAQVVSRTESPSAASFSVHQEMNAQELATLIRSHVLNANNSDNFVNEQHRQGCPAYEAVLEDVISPWRINDTIRGSTIPPKTLTSWCDMTVTGGEADDGALIALHSDGEEPLQMFVKVCGKEAVLEREKIKEGIRPPSVRDLQHEYRHLTYTLQQVMKHRLPSQPMVFAMRTGEMPGVLTDAGPAIHFCLLARASQSLHVSSAGVFPSGLQRVLGHRVSCPSLMMLSEPPAARRGRTRSSLSLSCDEARKLRCCHGLLDGTGPSGGAPWPCDSPQCKAQKCCTHGSKYLESQARIQICLMSDCPRPMMLRIPSHTTWPTEEAGAEPRKQRKS